MVKKKIQLFEICGNTIKVKEENLIPLSQDEEQSAKVAALKKLGYELELVTPEPKVKKAYTKAKAETYIKLYDKRGLKAFKAFEEEAQKVAAAYSALVEAKKRAEAEDATEEEKKAAPALEEIAKAKQKMVIAGREAFTKQKAYFKEKYGEDAYKAVRDAK